MMIFVELGVCKALLESSQVHFAVWGSSLCLEVAKCCKTPQGTLDSLVLVHFFFLDHLLPHTQSSLLSLTSKRHAQHATSPNMKLQEKKKSKQKTKTQQKPSALVEGFSLIP